VTTTLSDLVESLDHSDPALAEQARRSLIAAAQDAVEPLVHSAHAVNLRLLANKWNLDPSDLRALQRRVTALGDIGSPKAAAIIAAAVADSTEGLAAVTQQLREAKGLLGSSSVNKILWLADKKRALAQLNKAACNALSKLPEEGKHQILQSLSNFSPLAQGALRRATRTKRWLLW
jgi:hypothetical protein